MYAPFFGLSKEPFSIAPDPRFLFMSEQHREALAHLLYGLGGGGGFVLLTGEIGAGKTTVCRCFLEQLPPHCTVAYVFNPKLTATELLQTVCGEFGIAPPLPADSVKAHVDALNRFLLDAHAQGRQAVLVIDEAQSLSADVLEQLRLLTNLETTERKLLQIVLIGQPELRDMLARPELEQLAQRVIARYHLGALSARETAQYVRHRFAIAGSQAPLPFGAAALARLHQRSGGVPRRINLLADRALLGAYAQGQQRVDRRTVEQAAREVFGARAAPQPSWLWPLAAAGVLALGLLAWWQWPRQPASGQALATRAAPPSLPRAVASAAAPAPVLPVPVFDRPQALLAAAHPQAATAWRELALRWNVAIGEGDPCAAAAQARLACFRSPAGGLALLRQVARPVVLVLRPPRGPALHAVLVGLGENAATLQVGALTSTLALPELLALWRGEFATFWRTPPGWREGSELAASPQGRSWLEQRLASAGQGSAQPLAERVRAFQLAQGLPLDGLAGPLTLMQLNRATAVDEPRLAQLR
jgi:general secretion pathway protein A